MLGEVEKLCGLCSPLAAFDVARSPDAALEQVIRLGFRRLLTSGQAASVDQGMELISRLERQVCMKHKINSSTHLFGYLG